MNRKVLKLLAFCVLATSLESTFCNTDSDEIDSSVSELPKITDEDASGYIRTPSSSCQVKANIKARIDVTWKDQNETFNLFTEEGTIAPLENRTFKFEIKHTDGKYALKIKPGQGFKKRQGNIPDTSSAYWILKAKGQTQDEPSASNKELPIALALGKESVDAAVYIDKELTVLNPDFENISGVWNLIMIPEVDDNQKMGEFEGSIEFEITAIK